MSLLNTTSSSEIIPRQVETGQLAVAGVAIAVISMVLEFIAMSGFAPAVSLLSNAFLHNGQKYVFEKVIFWTVKSMAFLKYFSKKLRFHLIS